MRKLHSFVVMLTLTLIASFCLTQQAVAQNLNYVERLVKTGKISNHAISKSSQLIVVLQSKNNYRKANLHTYEKTNGKWNRVMTVYDVNLGKNGMARNNSKKEGDGKTPEGLFDISSAFGKKNDVGAKLPFYELSGNQYVWVSDETSKLYNTIVNDKKGEFRNSKNEILNDYAEDLYKYAIVVDYNMNPAVKGKGSAIFIHVQRGKDKPTAGCVSLSQMKMVELLKWLNPSKKPCIYMGKL